MTDWNGEVAALQSGLDPPRSGPSGTRSPRGSRPGPERRHRRGLREARRGAESGEVRLVYEALAKDRRIAAEDLGARPRPDLGRAATAPGSRGSTALKKAATAPPPQAPGARRDGPDAPPTYVLHRGDYNARDGEAAPAFPPVLCRDDPAAVPTPTPSARLDRAALGPGRLAGPARPPADGPRDRQPALAAPFRPGDRRHARATSARWGPSRPTPSCSTGWPPSCPPGAGA